MSEFVSREEFENLKSEVAEIKDELSKSGELLINIDKRTDVILEKLDNLDKVSNMQIEPLKKDITKNTEDIKEIKSNNQWLWRTSLGIILGIVIKIIFDMYKG
jgi:transcriptional regulator NrdR family protein